jgi:hypothetical protein
MADQAQGFAREAVGDVKDAARMAVDSASMSANVFLPPQINSIGRGAPELKRALYTSQAQSGL